MPGGIGVEAGARSFGEGGEGWIGLGVEESIAVEGRAKFEGVEFMGSRIAAEERSGVTKIVGTWELGSALEKSVACPGSNVVNGGVLV